MADQRIGAGEVVTYDPKYTVVEINDINYVHINSIEATPIDDDQYTTEKATTGERAWIRSPEFGAEVTIEFSGGLPGWARTQLRNLIGRKVDVTVQDRSGTNDGVVLTQARLVQRPDFSRDESEPTYEAVFQSPHAEWGSDQTTGVQGSIN